MRHLDPLLLRPLLGLFALALVAVGCGPMAGPASPAPSATPSAAAPAAVFPRTVVDSRGTKLDLPAAPRRIVSLSPGVTEILYAVGAGSQVVATDRFSDYPAEAARTPKLDYSQPSAEAALSFTPDLVIMATRQEKQVEQFRNLKLPVLFMEEPKSLDGVIESIRLYGEITGHEREAGTLAETLRRRITDVTSRVPAGPGPRVFFELSPAFYTVSPDSFIGSMLTLLKAQNVATGAKTAFPQLSAEAVIAANPQVVLLSDANERSGNQSPATVSARPGWGAVEAVRSQRIYPVESDLVNRPGPRVVDGFETLARALYPDVFGAGGTPTPAATSGTPGTSGGAR